MHLLAISYLCTLPFLGTAKCPNGSVLERIICLQKIQIYIIILSRTSYEIDYVEKTNTQVNKSLIFKLSMELTDRNFPVASGGFILQKLQQFAFCLIAISIGKAFLPDITHTKFHIYRYKGRE